MNFSVAYFREGRFERTCDVQICPRQDRRTTLTQLQGHWRQNFSQNIHCIDGCHIPRGPENLDLLCPAPKKGQPRPPIPDSNGDVVYVFIWGSN